MRYCQPQQYRDRDRGRDTSDVPELGGRITFVNVAPDGVRLIAKDKPERLLNLAKIFLGIYPHQRARGAVLFA